MDNPTAHGHIDCRHIPYSRKLRSFIEKQIRSWVRAHGAEPDDPDYSVVIRREGSGHTVNCHVQVRLGKTIWVGSNYGEGLHQALIRCLERMIQIPSLPRLGDSGLSAPPSQLKPIFL